MRLHPGLLFVTFGLVLAGCSTPSQTSSSSPSIGVPPEARYFVDLHALDSHVELLPADATSDQGLVLHPYGMAANPGWANMSAIYGSEPVKPARGWLALYWDGHALRNFASQSILVFSTPEDATAFLASGDGSAQACANGVHLLHRENVVVVLYLGSHVEPAWAGKAVLENADQALQRDPGMTPWCHSS